MKIIILTAITFLLVAVAVPSFHAFEAHVVNVTAEIVQIDPPSTNDGRSWDQVTGNSLRKPVELMLRSRDPDATHLFYSFGSGTNPSLIEDPVCGGPLGGFVKQQLNISEDTVVKAISCNGDNESAESSVMNVKVYSFVRPEPSPTKLEQPQESKKEETVAGEVTDEPEVSVEESKEELVENETPKAEEVEATTLPSEEEST